MTLGLKINSLDFIKRLEKYCLIALLPYCLIALLPYCLIALYDVCRNEIATGQWDDI